MKTVRRRFFSAPAALVGCIAAAPLAVAVVTAPTSASLQRPLPLHPPAQLTAGPLLGFVSGDKPTAPVRLARIDPSTLEALGGRSLRLPFEDTWAVAPNGRALALAVHPQPVNEPNSIELVRLPALRREPFKIRVDGDVSALAWTSQREVVALVGKTICCGYARLRAVAADVRTGRIVWRRRIPGTVLHLGRMSNGLALLSAPVGRIGRASLVLVDARGVRIVRLPMSAGQIPGGGGITRWQEPGLAVDGTSDRAFIIGATGPTVEVDLATGVVSSHSLSRRRSLLARFDDWLQPAASAKGDSGPIRQAEWLGNGYLLLTGTDQHDGHRHNSSESAGIELVDTRSWTERMLAPEADAYAIADGFLLADGAGGGLAAYGPDGIQSFHLFPGRQVWVDHVIGKRAYVGALSWKRLRVVDLSTGKVIGKVSASSTPTLLLGRGGLDDY